MPKIKDFQPYLLETLKDTEGACLFLESAIESNDRDVIEEALDNVFLAQQFVWNALAEQITQTEEWLKSDDRINFLKNNNEQDIETDEIPILCEILHKRLMNYVKELKTLPGLYKGYELQIEKLCNHLNLKTYDAELEETISGSIIKDDDTNTYSIYMNNKYPQDRRRFTAAFLVSQYILNTEREPKLMDLWDFNKEFNYINGVGYNYINKRCEAIANELLMPAKSVEELINQNLTPEEMAVKFFVSPSTMTMRLINLFPSLLLI